MSIYRGFRRVSYLLGFVQSLAASSLLLFPLLAYSPLATARMCLYQPGSDTACQANSDPGVIPTDASFFRHVGNPIDVVTGAKQQREIDFQAVGSPLHLSRYYYSGRSDANEGLGRGWRHSYLIKLVAVGSDQLRIQIASGRWIPFDLVSEDSGQRIYTPEVESDGYIVRGDTLSWFLPDGRTFRFKGSFLTQIDYPNDEYLRLVYKNRRLHSVSDVNNRTLEFEYNPISAALPDYDELQSGLLPGHLSSVRLPSGDTLIFGYDSNSNLVEVSGYKDEAQYYDYANNSFPSHLTQLVQQRKSSTKTRAWQYDAEGRVVRYIADTPNHSLDMIYADAASIDGIGETQVRYDKGQLQRYQWQIDATGESSKVIDVVTQDCETCKEIRFIPPQAKPIDIETVLQRVQNNQPIAAQSISAQLGSKSKNQTVVADSLDIYRDITLSDFPYRFHIEVNRFGEVTEISVGNTSLSEMKDKWHEGLVERCDFAPLFQRSQTFPEPEYACLEDLIYLIQLHDKVEKENAGHDLNDINDLLRGNNSTNAAHPCLVNPFSSCDELERNFELAQLSECAYREVDSSCGPDWEAVPVSQQDEAAGLFRHDSFSSTLFYNKKTDEYVLSFRGSDNLGDWKDNLLQAVGVPTSQFRAAKRLGETLKQRYPNANLSFTGHSLGGGLATTAAIATESDATVFNPSSLHIDTADELGLDYSRAYALVDVTTVDGDLLTSLQEPEDNQFIDRVRAPGIHTMLPAPDDAWVTAKQLTAPLLPWSREIVLHGIDAVLESVETILQKICGVIPMRA